VNKPLASNAEVESRKQKFDKLKALCSVAERLAYLSSIDAPKPIAPALLPVARQRLIAQQFGGGLFPTSVA
jgi:hypothetical protein